MSVAYQRAVPAVDAFSAARESVEGMIQLLSSRDAFSMDHAAVEEFVSREGREVHRRLLQAHLDLRAQAERPVKVVGADGVDRPERRRRTLGLTSLFGDVEAGGLLYQAFGVAGLAPSDASLNLPQDHFSLGVRRRVAEEVATGSYEDAVERVNTTTGATIAKRQAEQLARRAANDFEPFYATRPMDVADEKDKLLVQPFQGHERVGPSAPYRTLWHPSVGRSANIVVCGTVVDQADGMYLSQVAERFVEKAPLTVMARAAMEYALAPAALDALFGQHADSQYTRELLFSSIVELMSVVVSKTRPSIHAAYQAIVGTLPVSVTSVYNKLNGLEPEVTSAFVHHTAERLTPVVVGMGGQMPELLPGYRVRIIDGNHLAATERRLEPLRGSIAGPLPGHALVVLEPTLMLATHMIPCEDGHAQERSLFSSILALVVANDLWIADRNFCTCALLTGIARRFAFYVIRQHANLPIASYGTLRSRGRTATGAVFEQSVRIPASDGTMMKARRIVVRLDKPTRDGDSELAVLTNLPPWAVSAVVLAGLYRDRWTLETMFQSLAQMLNGEIDALGYPRAALFGFGVALATYNVLSTLKAALRAEFGAKKVETDVSTFYIAEEVRTTMVGMSIATESTDWEQFQTIDPAQLGKEMLRWAAHVPLRKLKRVQTPPCIDVRA